MPSAGGTELDGRDPSSQECRGIRGAVASDAQDLSLDRAADRLAQCPHVWMVSWNGDRRPDEASGDLDVGNRAYLGQDRAGVLPGQVADVDRHLAQVGN